MVVRPSGPYMNGRGSDAHVATRNIADCPFRNGGDQGDFSEGTRNFFLEREEDDPLQRDTSRLFLVLSA